MDQESKKGENKRKKTPGKFKVKKERDNSNKPLGQDEKSGPPKKKQGTKRKNVQTLSFDGLEVTPQLSNSKKRSEDDEKKEKKRKIEPDIASKMKKYNREIGAGGEKPVEMEKLRDKKLKSRLARTEKNWSESMESAARAEILLPSQAGYLEATGAEQTFQYKQADIKQHVDERSAQKAFSLNLDRFGPYCLDYTRNGRHLLMGGQKGHLAVMDWQKFKLTTELHLKETIRDVKFLHNETMFAVAQKKYVYIYDNTGVELHCLRQHQDVNALDFLHYFFLMTSVNKAGWLKYQDTSTGQNVCEHRTRLGDCRVLTHNPHNSVAVLGHQNGLITMWTPNMPTPVVKFIGHKAPVLAVRVDRGGHYMATSGLDGQIGVWDVRTYKQLHNYFTVRPSSAMSISDTGMLALGFGPHIHVWQDGLRRKQKSPYIVQNYHGREVEDLAFCPFEDVLGVGHNNGFESLLVPGAGEPNFDTFEANPYQTKNQRREATVHALLDKLQPDMITLNPNALGAVDSAPIEVKLKEEADEKAKNKPAPKKEKNKMRGKSKTTKKERKKKSNIIDQKAVERQEQIEKTNLQKKLALEQRERKQETQNPNAPPSALGRFFKK